jgi:hypothetical protein
MNWHLPFILLANQKLTGILGQLPGGSFRSGMISP